MTTDKQRQANRRNAKKSTGPRTEEGKARSRLNAWKHGILASVAINRSEDAAAFLRLLRSLHAEYAPQTPTEQHLVERLAAAMWSDRRAAIAEAKAAPREPKESRDRDRDPVDDLFYDGAMGLGNLLLVTRYQAGIDRRISFLLRTLDEVRQKRSKLGADGAE